jgi:hypothetical protein
VETPPREPTTNRSRSAEASAAANALAIGPQLLSGFAAHVVHVWASPFPSGELRRRLLRSAASLDEFAALLEREGEAEASELQLTA